MDGPSFLARVLIAVCLLVGGTLFAPTVQAQGKGDADAFESDEAAPAVPSPVLAPPVRSSSSDDTAAVVKSSPVHSKPARTGAPAEAGLPGWMSALPPPPMSSGLDWHGNLELDDGYVKYSWNTSDPPEKVYDSRGRFVLGPLLTHNLGNDYFLRVTGQVVAWVSEELNYYQINAEDVYVQVGQQGLWDFMAGRFLTWRVFRRGLGFDLYTLEDNGARVKPNFSDTSELFKPKYEVNTIFMRDSGTVPSARAAFHLYPTPWSGIELVGSYGRLQSGGNVLGGRLAAGIKQKYFNALVGAEYETWTPAQQQFQTDQSTGISVPCDQCGKEKKYGAGGSLAFTPMQAIEIGVSAADGKHDIAEDVTTYAHKYDETRSYGGYAQFDVGSLAMAPISFIVGGSWFHTEYSDEDGLYQRHNQYAGYLAYPLGFNNAVAKLVVSKASGHQEHRQDPFVDAEMYSVRLRFAYYY